MPLSHSAGAKSGHIWHRRGGRIKPSSRRGAWTLDFRIVLHAGGVSRSPPRPNTGLPEAVVLDTLERCWKEFRGRFQGRRPLPGIDFQAVRFTVPMARVLELLGFVPHESSGDQLRGACPIHGSSSPRSRSFSVSVGRNAYRCFKCNSSGNQLDLWAAVTKMDMDSAAIDLCEKAQVDIPWIRKW